LHTSHPNLRFPKKTKLGTCLLLLIVYYNNINLGVCNICTRLRSRKILATSATERQAIKRLMRIHTERMRADRNFFYTRRAASKLNPNIQWTILSDSTSGYILPFFFLKKKI